MPRGSWWRGLAGEISRQGLADTRIDRWNFHPRSPIDTPPGSSFWSHSLLDAGQPRVMLPFLVGTGRQRRKPICKSRRCPALHDVFFSPFGSPSAPHPWMHPMSSRAFTLQHVTSQLLDRDKLLFFFSLSKGFWPPSPHFASHACRVSPENLH